MINDCFCWISFTAPLLSNERSKVAEALVEVSFHDGEVIIREGEEGDQFYIVIEVCVCWLFPLVKYFVHLPSQGRTAIKCKFRWGRRGGGGEAVWILVCTCVGGCVGGCVRGGDVNCPELVNVVTCDQRSSDGTACGRIRPAVGCHFWDLLLISHIHILNGI